MIPFSNGMSLAVKAKTALMAKGQRGCIYMRSMSLLVSGRGISPSAYKNDGC